MSSKQVSCTEYMKVIVLCGLSFLYVEKNKEKMLMGKFS